MAELRKARLDTWKEVAAFFGKDERTVKRWEAERGLPVHRLPGAARSRIYVEVSELEEWLNGAARTGDAEPEPSQAEHPAPPKSAWRRSRGGIAAAAAILLALASAGAIGLFWPRTAEKAPSAIQTEAQPPPLAAQRLYLAGMDDWSRRTPDSLRRAVEEFNGAIRLSPGYAEAYAGLANCYNLLREYTLMPPAQAYPLAREAAKRALALNDRLASAHVALAFVDSWWDWDFSAATREYERAIALDPGSDLNHHWFATFLQARGDYGKSLSEFDKAQALNPASLAIRSDHGLVLYWAGRKAEGTALLLAVEKADPTFLSPHRYLAGIYQSEGRDQDFLRESEIAARMTDDRQRLASIEAARIGLARGGRPGMLAALLDEELQQFKYGVGTAYAVANTYALIGRTDDALAYLQTAIDRREEQAVSLDGDLAFASIRTTPRFRALIARVKPSPEASQSL